MGRWLEVVDKDFNIIKELAPNLLIHLSQYWPKDVKIRFPILTNLNLNSSDWIDENQNFKDNELIQLKDELELYLKVLNFEAFVQGFDTNRIIENFRNEDYTFKDYEEDLRSFVSLFEECIQNNFEVKFYL
ncbi:hypothetical protein BTO06_14300 [Tenacibaculum sp. SZ-18]|uniref:hypothetical protein n=1 Tax=Tenacibaculum sp. SZ-18 TaxID=754423 RepID=UPI000C2D1CC2|nr:hypothetical protein [Tenacibaculum sp. SZ-18]AUC16260.1 hypothetical protein BTO06_14300 [Tenacibaculum sp. SZ-18]